MSWYEWKTVAFPKIVYIAVVVMTDILRYIILKCYVGCMHIALYNIFMQLDIYNWKLDNSLNK